MLSSGSDSSCRCLQVSPAAPGRTGISGSQRISSCMAIRQHSRRREQVPSAPSRKLPQSCDSPSSQATVFFARCSPSAVSSCRAATLCRGLRFQCGSCRDFGAAQRCPRFRSLHLAIAGSFGIAGGHACRRLRGAAARSALRFVGRGLRHNGKPFAALVRRETPIHFLLPRWLGGGLAHQCAQFSRFPSDTVLLGLLPDRKLCSGPLSDQPV